MDELFDVEKGVVLKIGKDFLWGGDYIKTGHAVKFFDGMRMSTASIKHLYRDIQELLEERDGLDSLDEERLEEYFDRYEVETLKELKTAMWEQMKGLDKLMNDYITGFDDGIQDVDNRIELNREHELCSKWGKIFQGRVYGKEKIYVADPELAYVFLYTKLYTSKCGVYLADINRELTLVKEVPLSLYTKYKDVTTEKVKTKSKTDEQWFKVGSLLVEHSKSLRGEENRLLELESLITV